MTTLKVFLIGTVLESFDGGFVKPTDNSVRCKFSILREDSGLTMLVHLKEEPTAEHSDAIGFYLHERGLSEVVVRGGGQIAFYNNEHWRGIQVSMASADFGCAATEEVRSILQEKWGNADIDFEFINRYEAFLVEEKTGALGTSAAKAGKLQPAQYRAVEI